METMQWSYNNRRNNKYVDMHDNPTQIMHRKDMRENYLNVGA